ncbi:unnamed protein product [Rangifer tarandus platyrhynchus]|uniref:Uncharacterized protein n=1 Tax=Rangifer tarandus platyrhynchus TaxID=3082113 RepID=A0AC59YG88_RANTA
MDKTGLRTVRYFQFVLSKGYNGFPDRVTVMQRFWSLFKMDSPDVPLWSQIQSWFTSPSWWKIILTGKIVIILFFLFSPYICNCIMKFVYKWLEGFKLQMVLRDPTVPTAFSSYYSGPLNQRPSI